MTVHIIYAPEIVTTEMLNAARDLAYRGRTHFADIFPAMDAARPAKLIQQINICGGDASFPPDARFTWHPEGNYLAIHGREYICGVHKSNVLPLGLALTQLGREIE